MHNRQFKNIKSWHLCNRCLWGSSGDKKLNQHATESWTQQDVRLDTVAGVLFWRSLLTTFINSTTASHSAGWASNTLQHRSTHKHYYSVLYFHLFSCLSFCPSVHKITHKISKWILMNIFGGVQCGPQNNWLYFTGNANHDLSLEMFKGYILEPASMLFKCICQVAV